jgi:hypothetical protein
MPPIHLSPCGLSSPIDFHLEPRQPVDPPVPPSLAFRLVEQFIRLPDDLPKEELPPAPFFVGSRSPAPSLPPLHIPLATVDQ